MESKEIGYICKKCQVYVVDLQDEKEQKKGKKCGLCKQPMEVLNVESKGEK